MFIAIMNRTQCSDELTVPVMNSYRAFIALYANIIPRDYEMTCI